MDRQDLPPKTTHNGIYEAAAKATDGEEWPEYSKHKRKRTTHSKQPLIIGLAIIAVLALAAGAYFMLKPSKAKTLTVKASASTTTQPAPQVTGTSGAAVNYVSNGKDLNLSFNYPATWTVAPASNDNSTDQTITLNSPSSTVQAADGTNATGKVTVTIRPGSATISELNANSPVAAQTSAQFSYSQPTAAQHQYPYLTYIHFSNGLATAGAFEEVIITGVQTFTKGAPLSAGSLGDLDPIIGASFYRCSTTTCSGTGAGILSISNTTWQNATLFQQVQALFTSLKLN